MSTSLVAHPGSLLPTLILERSQLSQSALARRLGFNQPQPVNEIINGKRGITPKMALLLERLSQSEYPAEFWLLLQLRWDLEQARRDVSPTRQAMVQPTALDGDALQDMEPEELRELYALSESLREIGGKH